MGRPDLAEDPRFKTGAARRQHGRQLHAIIGEWVAGFPGADEVLPVLGEARIPCAPVLRRAELIAAPHLAVREFFPSVSHPKVGAVRVTACPYHVDGEPVHPRGPAAYRVGEHTRDVLTGLCGYDAGRLAELAAAGIIEAP